ncbi:MAG: HAMP domain-containing protein, partial [Caldilineaceae bacterium]|nr:HAMP domain-containing protein [Caldilineaceae bacterium]
MRSLTTKLTLSFWLVALVGVLIVAFFVARRAETAFNRFLLDSDQQMVVDALTRYYAVNGSWDGLQRWAEQDRPLSTLLHRFGDRRGLLVDPAGNVLLADDRDRIRPTVPADQVTRGVPIRDANGQPVAYLLLDGPPPRPTATPEADFLARLRWAVFWGALGATLVALLAGVLLARTIARPVGKLTAATQELAGGDLGYQVEVNSRDEIGQLARSFNAMSASLAESSRLRKQMTADIAHDLRTPLSVILGYTEAL